MLFCNVRRNSFQKKRVLQLEIIPVSLRFPMCKFKKSGTLIGEKCNIYALEVPKSKDFCLSELLIAKISNYMHQSALKTTVDRNA